MSEPTTGPWTVEVTRNHGIDIIGSPITDMPPEFRRTIAHAYNAGDIANTEANARLIAAAPQLLQACLDAAESIKRGGEYSVTVLKELNDAIAKARGQEVKTS